MKNVIEICHPEEIWFEQLLRRQAVRHRDNIRRVFDVTLPEEVALNNDISPVDDGENGRALTALGEFGIDTSKAPKLSMGNLAEDFPAIACLRAPILIVHVPPLSRKELLEAFEKYGKKFGITKKTAFRSLTENDELFGAENPPAWEVYATELNPGITVDKAKFGKNHPTLAMLLNYLDARVSIYNILWNAMTHNDDIAGLTTLDGVRSHLALSMRILHANERTQERDASSGELFMSGILNSNIGRPASADTPLTHISLFNDQLGFFHEGLQGRRLAKFNIRRAVKLI